MRILIIDDDWEGTEYLSTFLRLEGFTVHTATDGAEGLKLLQQFARNLVILDILLPDIDGWELCRQIRAVSDIPVVMLTAFATATEEQVRGFTCGADDYLVKPIDFDLLKALLIRRIRRTEPITSLESQHKPVYADRRIVLDLNHQEIIVEGKRIHLTYVESNLLEILVRNANQTVPNLEIMEELWPGDISSDLGASRLYVYIGRLRKIIEPDPQHPSYIITDHGLGYRFMLQA